jgi:hypothetical protein
MSNESFESVENKLKLLKTLVPDSVWKSETKTLLLTRDPRRDLLVWVRPALISGLIFSFLVVSTGVLAAGSLPGEPLYPLKRALETVGSAFTKSEKRLIRQEYLTNKRIQELTAVIERNEHSSSEALLQVETSVNEIKVMVSSEQKKLTELAEKGEDVTELKETLANFVPTLEQKQEQLENIEPTLSQENQVRVGTVIDSLEEIKVTIKKVTLTPSVEGVDARPEEESTPLITPGE